MKITKKITATVLVFAMAVSGAAFAQNDDKGLTEAVVAVKSIVEIGEEYENFNYSSYDRNGEISWNLDWNSDDGYIGANVINNVVTYISVNDYKNEGSEQLMLGLVDAKKAADEFLKKAMPDSAELMEVDSDSDIIRNSNDYEYRIYYTMHVNGIPVQNHTCSITVEKSTGKVSNYSRSFYHKTPVEFESAEGIISIDEALGKFTDNIGFDLKYNLYRNYEEKAVTAKPVYAINGVGTTAIDAKTGEVYEIYSEDENFQYGGGGGASFNASKDAATEEGAVELSWQELEAVENVKGLLSKEDTAEMMKKQVSGKLAENLEIRYANLNKNYYNDEFIWNISFENGDGYYMSSAADAKTGRLISFSKSTKNINGNKKLTKEEARKIAEKYIKTVRFDEFALCEYEEEPIYDVSPLKTENSNIEEKLEDYYSFTYVRKANGLKCIENNITVGFDNTCGEINSFNLRWDPGLEFSKVDSAKTASEIAAAAKDKCGFALIYLANGKLVYSFEKNATFDAFTAETLDYNGEPEKEEYTPVMYDDIAGHWCEEIIVKLYENGVYKKSSSFKPDEFISQREALMMIAPTYRQQNDEKLYEWAVNSGFITEAEKNPDGAVSRKNAAKFFVIQMNYGELAEKYEIFKYPFDDICPDEYKGYVALCKAYGIVNGNGNGEFCPDNNVTNAEFASMIYKYKTR